MFANEPPDRSKPRVLFLHQSGELYGSDRVFLQVVSAVCDLVEPVVVLDNDGPLVPLLRELTDYVIIRELGVLRRKHFTLLGMLRVAFLAAGATFSLWRLIRRDRISLVYTNTIAVLPGALAARLSGVPHVWHIHEIVEHPRVLATVFRRIVCGFSDLIIANSRATANAISQYRSRPALRIIHNGIQVTPFLVADGDSISKEFGLNDTGLVIGMVGRVHFWKGQNVLVDAAAHLRQDGLEDFRVLIIGDVFAGYEWVKEQLQSRIRALGLEEHITLCGYRTDIPAIMSALDVVIVPSTLPEPFGLVTIEAMAAAKPVVATALGGSLEIVIDGVTGFLVPPDDPLPMAQRIIQLAQDAELRRVMGEHGRERVMTQFSSESFTQKIRQVVLEILDSAGGRQSRID